jgi:hypothetical protein
MFLKRLDVGIEMIKIYSIINKKTTMKKIIGIAMIIAFHSAVFAQMAPGTTPGTPSTTPGINNTPGSVPGTTTPPGVTPMPGTNQTAPNQGVYPNSTPGTTPGINNQNNSSLPGSKNNNIAPGSSNKMKSTTDTSRIR